MTLESLQASTNDSAQFSDNLVDNQTREESKACNDIIVVESSDESVNTTV